MTAEPVVLTEQRDGTLIITINRPEQRNAVNLEVAQAIADAMERLDSDSDLTAGVLTGAAPGFCAGMDLKAFATGHRPYIGDRGFAGITRRSADKPLVAAIEGFAVAGGLEVALSCDLIVASTGAKLAIPEVKRSIVAASGALLRLPRVLPRNIAVEMALTGDPITSDRAYQFGMVNRLVAPGEALAAALDLCEKIAPNGPLALLATKRILRESLSWPDNQFFSRQGEFSEPVLRSSDAREGAIAFAQKRRPVWHRT